MADRSFFSDLRDRKVFQAAAIYGAVAWGVTEILVTIVDQLFLPQWISSLAVIFFVVGFPVAMFLAWTFDLTPDGVRRTEIQSKRGTASIALSMLLLLAGTTGLFFLIKPTLDERSPAYDTALLAPNSVAVLPFDYASPNPEDSYLGPGLSDELRDQLGRVEGLRIAARSSSIAAVQKGVDAKSMARLLGVATVLEGSVRRQGNVLNVSVALIDGNSGLAIWNATFRRGPRELLNVQQEIAETVVHKMMPGSGPLTVRPATQDATANELMFLARRYEQEVRDSADVDPNLLTRAVELYRKATEADPASALAFSRLAVAQMFLGDINAAVVSATRALDLDPGLAEAHNAYGKFLFATGNERMGDELERAITLNPNLPDALSDYAFWYWFNVGTDGVAELYERALALDRLNVERYAALGHFLAIYDRPDDARALAEQMRILFNGPTAYRAIAHIYDLVGDIDHAIAWTIRARDAEPDNPLHIEALAEYYTDIGDYATASRLEPDLGVGLLFKMRRYDEMIDKAEEQMLDFPEDLQLRVYLGYAYNATGQFESAIRMIDTSGLLDGYAHSRRSTEESDGFAVLLDAAYGRGEVGEARNLAEWELATHYESISNFWWIALEHACTQAILGNDDAVHRLLKRAQQSDYPAWEPMLKDHQCFRRFADDPVYLATVRHFDERRALLRERLPGTLAHYGVEL